MNPANFVPTIAQVRMLNVLHKGPSYYKRPSYYRFGSGNVQLTESDTDLGTVIPVEDGVVNDDGSNTMTGRVGGSNSTDNTTTYKSGGGVSDVTAQNLIKNSSSTNGAWYISNLASAGVNVDISKYGGVNLYVKDQTTLDYFKSSGDCFELRFGSDVSNYYKKGFVVSDLSIGWNWVTDNTIINTWTEVGTVAATVDYYEIIIYTNNASDVWNSGDVIADLCRTWDHDDTKKSIKTGYPLVNESEVYAEVQCRLEKTEAVGFLITSYALYNEADEVMYFVQLSEGESKSSTDIFLANILRKERNRRVTI